MLTYKLDTLAQVHAINNLATTFPEAITATSQEGYRVDAKSTLGLFSLNIANPITLTFETFEAQETFKASAAQKGLVPCAE